MNSLFRSETPQWRVLSRSRQNVQRSSSPPSPSSFNHISSQDLHSTTPGENSESQKDQPTKRRRHSSSSTSRSAARALASAWTAQTFYDPLPPPTSTKKKSSSARNSMQSERARPTSPTNTAHLQDQPQHPWDPSTRALEGGHGGFDRDRRGALMGISKDSGAADDQSPTSALGATLDGGAREPRQPERNGEEEDEEGNAKRVATETSNGVEHQQQQQQQQQQQKQQSRRIVWDHSTDTPPKRPRRRRSQHRPQQQQQQQQTTRAAHDQPQQPKDTYTLHDRTSIVLETRGDIPPRLIGASTSVFARKMYVFGGLQKGSSRPSNCLYILQLDTLIWTKHVPHGNNNHNHHNEQQKWQGNDDHLNSGLTPSPSPEMRQQQLQATTTADPAAGAGPDAVQEASATLQVQSLQNPAFSSSNVSVDSTTSGWGHQAMYGSHASSNCSSLSLGVSEVATTSSSSSSSSSELRLLSNPVIFSPTPPPTAFTPSGHPEAASESIHTSAPRE
ncbi:hypothetical protein DFQ27_007300 [Actinomortierella ambigua]|uniref:Uncharacterized protein n=1 Tax=Actinomortierella ambigua TaxID=1343610 RepID=A0A9P6QGI4_9FUNG|nr:hypothetical protein DFQ27_007300 [Actinomortierella ambigua]